MNTKSGSHWLVYFSSIVAIIISCITVGASDDDRKVYIVYMGSLPKGDYSPLLHHLSILQEVVNGSMVHNHLVRSYTKSFNGFAARLTSVEQEKIASMEGVVSVFPDRNLQLQTTRSWDFTGFLETVKRVPSVESDTIIGVIDSGIWLQSKSFNDKGFGPPPKKWKGACKGGQHFTCNNKVIGARHYVEQDAIDRMGHGTQTASIAAGNIVKGASFYGLAPGNARGGVPSARIAIYKVCNRRGDFRSADTLGAFDDAIDDGVDVISVSLGLGMDNFDSDIFAIGAFHAMQKGILTSMPGCNDGPKAATISNVFPWALTVAASSTDRRIIDKVVLGDGTTLVGKSVNPFNLNGTKFPLVYGKDVSRPDCNASMAKLCKLKCLDSNLVEGKILVCDRYEGIYEALRVKALGVILLDNGYEDYSPMVPLPAAVLSKQDGNKLKSYINSTKMAQANILKSEAVKDFSAPIVPSFSSRGPNVAVKDILKPDITAPGVDILAAFSPHGNPCDGPSKGKLSVKYAVDSGTSMSTPHAAAAAAYVKTFHPKWSASAIKSALMTTARPMDATKNPDREFAYGSGHIDPVQAVKPGLVYEAFVGDYVKMLCSIGYDSEKVQSLSRKKRIRCPTGTKGSAKELNYPSMSAYINKKGPFKVQFPRTVTNVGLANSTYKASLSTFPKLNVNVKPQVLSFNKLGQKKSFVVTVEGGGIPRGSMVSGSLVWSDRAHSVRSPIVVYTEIPKVP